MEEDGGMGSVEGVIEERGGREEEGRMVGGIDSMDGERRRRLAAGSPSAMSFRIIKVFGLIDPVSNSIWADEEGAGVGDGDGDDV